MIPRAIAVALAAAAALFAQVAAARVYVSFYSVSGSVLTGRSVHAFIALDGTLDSDGRKVDENYGFSARTWNPAGFFRPVPQTMLIETRNYISRARYHFRVPISDDTYRKIVGEAQLWGRDPAYLWDIDKRNCVTFVGIVAQMCGLMVDFPPKIMRKPRAYLDHLAMLNPQLKSGAK